MPRQLGDAAPRAEHRYPASRATFSPQRRKAIYDGLLSLDVSPERANAFIDHPKSWELRPIKFVAYDEGLYEALQHAAR